MRSQSRSFAEGTTVEATSSQAELIKMLTMRGVKQSGFFNDGDRSWIVFAYGGLTYRISILMPDSTHEAFGYTPTGQKRNAQSALNAYHAEVRRRWRSLVLLVKAKLIACDDDITTFEEEFLNYAITSNDQTVGERMIPEMKKASAEGRLPRVLSLPGVQP